MPELPDLGGVWEVEGQSGRRLTFGGDVARGPGEVWTHPFRLLHDLRISGRTTACGAALELPLAIWDIEAAGTAPHAVWSVDLPQIRVSGDGARALCIAQGGAHRGLFAVQRGMLSVEGNRMAATTTSPSFRLIAIGAVDDEDLRRTLDLLGRRHVAGLARQRAQHAEQVTRGGAALRTPDDEATAAAFEAAKVEADAEIAELPGWGRAPLDHSAGSPGSYVTRTACWTSLALLAAGMRDAARDTLRFLARRQDAAGDIPVDCALDGATRFAGGEGAAHFLLLAARHDAWAGDAALRDELAPVMERAQKYTAAVSTAERGRPPAGPAAVLLDGVERLWGVEPDAPREALRLRPALPAGWTRMSLARLRVGRTVLDLHLRRRAESVQLTVRRGSGPRILVDCEVAGSEAAAAELDGVPMGSPRVRFEASGDHELLLRAGR